MLLRWIIRNGIAIYRYPMMLCSDFGIVRQPCPFLVGVTKYVGNVPVHVCQQEDLPRINGSRDRMIESDAHIFSIHSSKARKPLSRPAMATRKRTKLSPSVRLSKKLSAILRHKAVSLGLAMTPDGYVAVPDLLQLDIFRGTNVDTLREIVTNCEKQRFKLKEDESGVLYIRANQGHSVAILDADQLLTRLETDTLASMPTVIHGTTQQAWETIRKEGLSRMGRTHIHFATGLPKDDGVISGMRKSCQVHIYIDTKKCAEDGILFYRSDNNVILTAGVDEKGILPPTYFQKATDNRGNDLGATTPNENVSRRK